MKLSKHPKYILLSLLVLLFSTVCGFASTAINYQGYLQDIVGNPLPDGTYSVSFRIYDVATEGDPLWQENLNILTARGAFNATLGLSTPFPVDLFKGDQRYVEVVIDGNPLSPRQVIVSTPYALHAYSVEDGSVSSNSIKNNSIYGAHIANGVINSNKIADGSVTGADIADGSVTGADIATGALNGGHIQDGAFTGADIQDGSISGIDIAAEAIDSAHIATDAVTGDHVQNGSLTGNDMAVSALTGTHIQNGSLWSADIADNSILGVDVFEGTLTGYHIQDGSLKGVDIANASISGVDIADGTVGGVDIADGAVTSAKITDGTIGDIDINYIDLSKIDPGFMRGDFFSVYSRSWGSFPVSREYYSRVDRGASNAAEMGLYSPGLTPVGQMINRPYLRLTDDKGIVKVSLTLDGNRNGFLSVVGGTKNFVEDHPLDADSVIVYSSLEGSEAGMYHRGTIQLVDGLGVIELPDHFSLLAAPDTLTVTLTPVSLNSTGLGVDSKNVERIVIGELFGGTGSYEVDFMVTAVRKGFEDRKTVRLRSEVFP